MASRALRFGRAGAPGPGLSGVGRLIYRPVLVRLAAVIYLAFALWWLAALLTGLRPVHALAVAPGLAAVGVLVHQLFWRPAVAVDEKGVELRNVLRDVRVPWSRLAGLDTRFTLTLTADGVRYQSWAASAPGRPTWGHGDQPAVPSWSGPAGGHSLPQAHWTPGELMPTRSSQDLRADSGAAAFMVAQRWAAWQDGRGRTREPTEAVEAIQAVEGERVRVRWNVAPAVALLACVLLSAAARAAGA